MADRALPEADSSASITDDLLIWLYKPTSDELFAQQFGDLRALLASSLPSGAGWTVAAAAPDSPSNGDGWYDTANHSLKIFDGSIWRVVGHPLPDTSAYGSIDAGNLLAWNNTSRSWVGVIIADGTNTTAAFDTGDQQWKVNVADGSTSARGVLQLSDATPQAPTTAGAAGTSGEAADAAHEHPVGSVQPVTPSHNRLLGLSADTTFSDAEFSVSSTTDSLTFPASVSPANVYLAFAVPDDTGDLTSITPAGGFNELVEFQRVSGTRVINGTTYKVWRSTYTWIATAIQGTTWNLGQAN